MRRELLHYLTGGSRKADGEAGHVGGERIGDVDDDLARRSPLSPSAAAAAPYGTARITMSAAAISLACTARVAWPAAHGVRCMRGVGCRDGDVVPCGGESHREGATHVASADDADLECAMMRFLSGVM